MVPVVEAGAKRLSVSSWVCVLAGDVEWVIISWCAVWAGAERRGGGRRG